MRYDAIKEIDYSVIIPSGARNPSALGRATIRLYVIFELAKFGRGRSRPSIIIEPEPVTRLSISSIK
jgi:hypothetical protein